MTSRGRRILALIAARSGSRGLRGKNMRELGGVSLLARAIHLAHASRRRGESWSVVVSTNSRRYRALAIREGADVPFLRPPELARDDARLIDVVLHALVALEAHGRFYDTVVLLSPTTPLTSPRDVRRALALHGAHEVAVVSVAVPAAWHFSAAADGRLHAISPEPVGRRQLGNRFMLLNGAIYVAAPSWLRTHRRFLVPERTIGLEMPAARSLDIENAADLSLAAKRLFDTDVPRG
ncbi:MAG: acylneuraminate cytidylyltransferase family protein [Myxococcota bacterium]